jgi:hypothetical protein
MGLSIDYFMTVLLYLQIAGSYSDKLKMKEDA